MRRLLFMLCLLPAPVAAAQWVVHYEGGITVASGDYTYSERTTSLSWMTGLALERGRVTLRAGVPVWFRSSTLVTMTGSGVVPNGGGPGRDTASGTPPRGRHVASEESEGYGLVLGDPAFHLSFRAFERLDTNVGMWMSVKVPVASSAEFGTGEWDLGGGLSMLCFVGTRWLGALDLSHWHLGDTPALDFHDPVGSIASVTRFAGDWAIAASASVSSATIAGYDPAVAVGAGITRRVGTGSWTTHLSFGVTDTAAQLVAAVLWRVPLLTQRHGRIQ